MNWGPLSDTMSSGIPKFRKMWWKRVSAVSKAMDNPRRGICLQAFENLSTTTKMVVYLSEGGRSVAKSFPRWDQGRCGMGSRTNLPSGRRRGVEVMAQTEQLLTKRATSWAMLGHQYRFRRSERVRWMPGWPDPGEVWMESRRVRRKAVGIWSEHGDAGLSLVVEHIAASELFCLGIGKAVIHLRRQDLLHLRTSPEVQWMSRWCWASQGHPRTISTVASSSTRSDMRSICRQLMRRVTSGVRWRTKPLPSDNIWL